MEDIALQKFTSMNKKEAKEYTLKYMEPYYKKLGFSLIKEQSSTVIFRKKNHLGYDGFASGTLNYSPVQIIRYSVYKRIDIIEEITAQIGAKFELNPPVNKESLSLAFGYETLNKMNRSFYLPECTTEGDIEKSVNMIIEFMEKTAISLLDRFNDLRELDKEINGENFWETDWQNIFNLGGNFYIKRLIIAKLSGSPTYDETVEKVLAFFEKLALDNNEEFMGKNNSGWSIGYTIDLLKTISPIY